MKPEVIALKTALASGSALSLLGHDPYMTHNFIVEIGGVVWGGFSQVSGLSSEITLETYEEGGMNDFVYHFPTRTTYPNLVLTRGLVNIDLFWHWYSNTSKGIINPMNGTIIMLNSQQIPVLWWNFKKAYPVKWEGPQFNASADTDIAVEKIELVHQGIMKL